MSKKDLSKISTEHSQKRSDSKMINTMKESALRVNGFMSEQCAMRTTLPLEKNNLSNVENILIGLAEETKIVNMSKQDIPNASKEIVETLGKATSIRSIS